MKNKKAVSPIISTVLLIMIVIIIAIIIILWARGFVKEVIEKDIGGNVKRVNEYCNEIQLETFVNEDDAETFGFRNIGNVPIYQFQLKLKNSDGSSELKEFEGPNAVINPGFGITIEDKYPDDVKEYDSYEEVKVIPVLLGKVEKGGVKPFVCPEETAKII